jgi:2-C-methyl-D-erythritol 4-phosphate cytidylyltransferase
MGGELIGGTVRDVAVIVAAAGSGERLGMGVPKALVPVGGRAMLAYSLLTLAACPRVAIVIVAAPPDHVTQTSATLEPLALDVPVSVVAGGESRQDSVRRALDKVEAGVPIVVCHDAARPFASVALFGRVIDGISNGIEGVVPVLRPADTVKRLEDDTVAGTIPRHSVGLAQTPQAFAAPSLRRAHARAERESVVATDDAMLLEAAAMRVVAVPGEASNIKVTAPEDLERAERMMSRSGAAGSAGG